MTKGLSMLKFFAMSLAASALTAVPALAQDTAAPVQTQEMPAAPAAADRAPADEHSSFLGFRVEGDAGGDRFQSQGHHNDKFGYGATIGFDGQIGDRIVVGPEATYWRADGWNEKCTATAANSVCSKSFQEYGVGVRAGYLVTPQLLVFGKGGYVGNEQRKRISAPTGATTLYDHYNTDGYQLGGGVQYGIGNRFSGPLSGLYVNAQYVYSQYADHTSRQRLMGGVGIHFK